MTPERERLQAIRERVKVSDGWYEGLASDIPFLLDQLEQAEQRLTLIHRNATSWHASEAGKDRALAVIADWASGGEVPQVLLDDLAAQSKESEDSRA